MPWRDLPERFGDSIKIHTRFSRWAKSGVWKKVFEILAADADNEYAMIDSTIVRAHQHSAGAQKQTAKTRQSGRSKGGLSTKIHALVDALGNPLAFLLTPGQAHDLQGADALLPQMQADTLLADKAFDADERVIEPLLAAGKTLVIAAKANRKVQRSFDNECTRRAISSRISSASSSNFGLSLPVTTKRRETSSPEFNWPQPSFYLIEDRP